MSGSACCYARTDIAPREVSQRPGMLLSWEAPCGRRTCRAAAVGSRWLKRDRKNNTFNQTYMLSTHIVKNSYRSELAFQLCQAEKCKRYELIGGFLRCPTSKGKVNKKHDSIHCAEEIQWHPYLLFIVTNSKHPSEHSKFKFSACTAFSDEGQ